MCCVNFILYHNTSMYKIGIETDFFIHPSCYAGFPLFFGFADKMNLLSAIDEIIFAYLDKHICNDRMITHAVAALHS